MLPFFCPGGTPDQEAFADGITESLITDLSRQSGLAVVARATSPAFRGKSADVRELGRTLGVHYVIEGSVQHGARQVRVNVQLISAGNGLHLWADRFDKELGDVLDLQDEIVERCNRALAVQLREAEIRRATDGLGAPRDPATLVLLGRRTFLQGAGRTNCMRAAALYADALKLDDRNALAHAMLSITKTAIYAYRWSDTVDAELEEAVWHRDRAWSLDPTLPFAHVASAWILVAAHKHAAALAAFDRIAQASPLAGGNAFANLAVSKNNVGRSVEAEIDLLRVIRVTPGDPQMDWWHYYLGATYSYLGRYPEAADALRYGISLNPEFDAPHILLAAVCVELGSTDDAVAAIRHAQSLGTRWTTNTLKSGPYSGVGVGIDDERMTALWDGLRFAGLPE